MYKHLNFYSQVNVARLTEPITGSKVMQFMAELTIVCVDCGTPFGFVDLPGGCIIGGNAMSPDTLEARLTIEPRPVPRNQNMRDGSNN